MADITEAKVAQKTLEAVQEAEKRLDAELHALENLTDDDLARIRQQRLKALKELQDKEAEWRRLGHGSYHEVGDQAEWFQEVKSNERVICHFYTPTNKYCQVVDKHLEKLAHQHIETRFIKINGEKSPFLAQRLNIVIIPTIVCTKDNYSEDMVEGFDELGGTDRFSTYDLAKRLAKKGALFMDKVEQWRPKKEKPLSENTVKSNKSGNAIYGGNLKEKLKALDAEDSDPDFWASDNED